MEKICNKCGLPKELCACEVIAKEREAIKVYIEAKRYGKSVTIVEGISKDMDSKSILKELKTRLACGGTLKDSIIELQGNHKDKVKSILMKLGFNSEQIEVG